MRASHGSTTLFSLIAICTLACSTDTSTHDRPQSPSIASLTGDARQVAQALGELHTGLLPAELARLCVAIADESRRAEIPTDLVLSLIRVESSGNAFAVSNVGAMGLMQLRPSTAEQVAGDLGIRWTGAAMLFEPVTNVRLGVEYLRQMIDRYDSVETALAAYNWGPGRIGQKLRRGEAIPVAYANKVLSTFDEPRSSSI